MIATFLSDACEATEIAERGIASIVGRHAGRTHSLSPKFNVLADLLGHFGLEASAAKHCAEPETKFVKPRHGD